MSGPVAPVVFANPAQAGATAAQMIAAGVMQAAQEGRRYLLGCPSGRSPMPVYAALASEVKARALDLSHVTIVMMDEYLAETAAGLRPVDPGLPHSCVGFAQRLIVSPLAQAAQAAGVAGPGLVMSPSPADPELYDAQIAALGGIDLFILASGASDGHVAFNQPGTPRGQRTHVVALGEATRTDNLRTFPTFGSLDDVPRYGISVGVSTIAECSRRAVMVLFGEEKVLAYRRICDASRYEPDWPSTIVAECADAHVFADPAAAGIDPGSPAMAGAHPSN